MAPEEEIENAIATYLVDFQQENAKAVPADKFQTMLEHYLDETAGDASWSLKPDSEEGDTKIIITGQVLDIIYEIEVDDDGNPTGYSVTIDATTYPKWHPNHPTTVVAAGRR